MVKNPPTNAEDARDEDSTPGSGRTTISPWTEEPRRLPWGCIELDVTEHTHSASVLPGWVLWGPTLPFPSLLHLSEKLGDVVPASPPHSPHGGLPTLPLPLRKHGGIVKQRRKPL